MSVRFTRHAIGRLKSRFGGLLKEITEVVERGIFECGATPAGSDRWAAEGLVRGRLVRAVYVEDSPGRFVIVTVMWCG